MILGFIMAMAAPPDVICTWTSPELGIRFLSGEHTVTPVADRFQADALKGLRRGVPRPITAAFARAATGNPSLGGNRYHYLAKAGYLGLQTNPPSIPGGVSFDVDVSDKGVAYLTSFRMSSRPWKAELAVVLTSETPLKRVVSLCGAAE